MKAKDFVKPAPLMWAVMLSLAAGGTGYWLRERRAGPDLLLPISAMPPLEYLMPPDSFSRIENTKILLDGLCVRLRLGVQSRALAGWFAGRGRAAAGQESDASWDGAIRDLERGMREFEGTQQELDCAQELFRDLKIAGRSERCVEVYLKALYEHPTHPFVARSAAEAIRLGQSVGREGDVIAGLNHLLAIPLAFQGKETVNTVLGKAKADQALTQAGVEPSAAIQSGRRGL